MEIFAERKLRRFDHCEAIKTQRSVDDASRALLALHFPAKAK
jgi:hypothetical protein